MVDKKNSLEQQKSKKSVVIIGRVSSDSDKLSLGSVVDSNEDDNENKEEL